jgi:hypothetical protein
MTQGRISPAGAVIDVLVGVSPRREQLLLKHMFKVPDPVAVRAQIDTGANVSGFAGRVFAALDVTPVTKLAVITPAARDAAPQEFDAYDVTLYLVSDGIPRHFVETQVIASYGWHPTAEDGVEGVVGRDVLNRCHFMYYGVEGTFTIGFGDTLPPDA